jgi:hypothetical protein
METYFKWLEPKSFARKERKESIKTSFKPLLHRFILGFILIVFIILVLHFAPLDRGEKPSVFILLGLLIASGLILFALSPFFVLLVSMIFPAQAKKVKVSEKGVHAIGANCLSWHYPDIESFQIRQEHIENEIVHILELKNFDGRVRAIGLAPDISTDDLSKVVLERIALARARMKKRPVILGRGWRTNVGFLLMAFGLICLMALHAVYSDQEITQKRAGRIAVEAARIADRIESEKLSKPLMGVLEEVIKLSVSANVELAHRTKILMGISIASSLVLLGAVLALWGNNIFLKNRIVRLQAYQADIIENASVQQESEA